jgi:hypothetical protein
MSKVSRQAGQNIRELAITRRSKAITCFISAGFLVFIPSFLISPIFYVLCVLVALGLISSGAFLWKRANHADQGAKGEEVIAQEMNQLEQRGWKIEYGIRLRDRLSDIDIFCVSPQNKAYVIDVKSHRGEVITDGKDLYRRMGNRKYAFEKNFLKQVMRQALQIKEQKSLVFVTPIVAFSNAKVSMEIGKLQNVYVVARERLVTLLKALG